MKTTLVGVDLLVCGIRPATISYDEDSESYLVESPPCEQSMLKPSTVYERFNFFNEAIEFCKLLVAPFIDNGAVPNAPRLAIKSIRLSVSRIVDNAFLAYVAVYYNNSDYDSDDDNPLFATVSVPDIDVSETFYSVESARNFCRYLMSPFSLIVDTEAN